MLHVYAGLISLYLAQPTPLAERSAEGRTLRDAQQYFDRARVLSPHDPVTSSWLEKVRLSKKKPLIAPTPSKSHLRFLSSAKALEIARRTCQTTRTYLSTMQANGRSVRGRNGDITSCTMEILQGTSAHYKPHTTFRAFIRRRPRNPTLDRCQA